MNRVLFSFDAIGVVMVVTDNILVSYLFMRVRKCCLDVCVCEDISKSPGCERNWRSRWTAEKEAKKTKKTRKETTNQRRKNTPRERQHTFNTISTTDTKKKKKKKNVYEENSGGIARRNNSAVSALCF